MSAELRLDRQERKQYNLVLPLLLFVLLVFKYRQGAYTDGILQITVFENKAGLYPPLYGALASVVDTLTFQLFSLTDAARMVSFVATASTFALVYSWGTRIVSHQVGLWGSILLVLSPLVWRWSSQIMTDPLYMALSTGAMFCLVESWAQLRALAQSKAAKWLAYAVCWGGLATLARYQGLVLAPLLVLVFGLYVKRFRSIPWWSVAAGLVWLMVPAWMFYNGFVHQDQFAERSSTNVTATFLAWWNTFESFVLISPYYLGYPIFAAAIAGIFWIKKVARSWYARPAAVLWGTYAFMLIVLQARFGSFQYRYMMPLLPMVCVLAGIGVRWLYDNYSHRSWLPKWTLIVSLLYLGFFGLSIRFLQGEPYLDQYHAAEFIKVNVPVTAPVYSNERYGNFTDLGSVKLSYWTGRPVKPLLSPDQPMEPGAVLVLGNAYGGNEAVGAMLDALSQRYELQPLISQPFRSQIVPLMDDIMVNPMFNQNPMGWVMRYVPQHFATNIYRVMPLGSAAAGAADAR